MTSTIDITDTEFAGAMKVRIADVDITNYDDDANGDGESFTPSDAGMHRFQAVIPEVKVGAGGASTVADAVAQYDWSNEAIRLFEQANDGTGTADDPLTEVPSNSNEGVEVNVICIGR